MFSQSQRRLNPRSVEPKGQPVGGTEYSWCRAVPGGTGIGVLALLVSKAPDISRLQNAINKLQNFHPILKSRLIHYSTNAASFITSPAPFVQIKSHSTLECLSSPENHSNISPFHLVLEHELNQNTWSSSCSNTADMLFFASIYALPNTKWVVVLRLHLSAFDRTTAASLLRELLVLMEIRKNQYCLECEEDLGVFGDLCLVGCGAPASRLGMRPNHGGVSAERVAGFDGCKSRRIKLCGALVAAGLIAAYTSKRRADNQGKKYGVTTLIDCRSILDPPLSSHHFGNLSSPHISTY
ncbi:uncharacterized protein LOC132191691 [Corylus avellana]|uniref:uncharacterized protein LOC132191691 n=1 Tax=Corylus avellana TaxID=13451 RepID=UPI00286CABD6|nr:uncharacterized protein LOC132191691 [Corylus avellana]